VHRGLSAQAVIFGKREDLLREAGRGSRRIPARTSRRSTARPTAAARSASTSRTCRSRSSAAGARRESTPSLQRTIQHSIYKGFAAPVALYGLLGVVMLRNRKSRGDAVMSVDAQAQADRRADL
jgi:hypothetical protein